MPNATEWEQTSGDAAWDRAVAAAGGHPLQSALWGTARSRIDAIADQRWRASGEGVVMLARTETRRIAPMVRAAWIPKGPHSCREASAGILEQLFERLRDEGYAICVVEPYAAMELPPGGFNAGRERRTAVVDLTHGRDRAWNATDKQWRYGVRSAARQGVTVDQTRDMADAGAFFALCERISNTKGFDLPGSLPLLNALLQQPASEAIEARLFCARLAGEVIAGAAVLRSGRGLHYFWGGVDRRFPKLRAGEAVQWAVMEWALENGIERYDLEGIDPQANPGTYAFKMKMGAREVTLPGLRAYPLSIAGRAALAAGRLTGKL